MIAAIHLDEDVEEHGRRLEETKRVARLVKLAALLAAQPGRWPRRELAARFEIGERQIARDLQVLRHGLGYQIARTPGGYVIKGAPALPPLLLALPEALALALAVGLARDAGGVDTATLGAVMAKLEAVVPPDAVALLRRDLAAMAPGRESGNPATLRLLQQARAEGRRVRMTYETGSRGGARSERVVEPYAVQHYGRGWLLVAYDHLRKAVRDFKVDRIRAATLLDERFTTPPDFSLASYRGGVWGVLRGEGGEPVKIALLFSDHTARWVLEEDRGVRMTAEPHESGRTLIRMETGITDEMVRWLLSFGPDCRVLTPANLAEQVRARAAETVDVYGE